MTDTTLAKALPATRSALDDALIKEIAMDIGKAVAHHIEIMYPAAVNATSRTMLLSVRNCAYNEIMAAIGTMDEEAIRARIAERKKHRRTIKSIYTKIRGRRVAR